MVLSVNGALLEGNIGGGHVAVQVALAGGHFHVGNVLEFHIDHLECRSAGRIDDHRGVHLGHIGCTGAKKRGIAQHAGDDGLSHVGVDLIQNGVRKIEANDDAFGVV